MLYWLFNYLASFYPVLANFHHVTLRAICAAITAFLLAVFFGDSVIAILKNYQFSQVIRAEGPQSHQKKQGTPTMGGAIILLSLLLSVLLWSNLANVYVWLVLFTTYGFAIIGAIDDLMKIKYKNTRGLSAKKKFFSQVLVAVITSSYLVMSATSKVDMTLFFPLFKDTFLYLGYFYIPFVICVIVGASNAVNLTDGLDGLATLPTVMISAALALIAYLVGHYYFASHISVTYIVGASELSIFCSAIVGSGLGFLWFNAYPAQIFMGDVGSLSLGAAMAIVAVIIKQELLFMLMSAVFVAETVSVILQVGSYKLTGKRIFKMAPLHHHFELKGWAEPKIIVRFWIITLMLVLVSLATLKLR